MCWASSLNKEGRRNAEREDGLIRLLIELRAQARANKDWATADQDPRPVKGPGRCA